MSIPKKRRPIPSHFSLSKRSQKNIQICAFTDVFFTGLSKLSTLQEKYLRNF